MKYKNIFDQNPQPLIIFSIDSYKVMEVNDASIQFYGFSRTEFLDKNLKELFDSREWENFTSTFLNPTDEDNVHHFWLQYKNDDSVAYTELHTQYFEYEGGNTMLLLVQDVTDTKIAEDKLKISEEWFKSIFNSSRDGAVVEMNEHILYANNAFLKLYGYEKPEELLGKKISIVHDASMDGMMLDYGKKRLRGEDVPEIYESKGKTKFGDIIDIEVSATVLTLRGQKYIIATNRDITERKNAERKLKEQNELLTKINSELDRFVYSASHDLKAPLSSVLGLINIALLEDNLVTKNNYLHLMTTSVHKLLGFVKDIVHYSRNSRLVVKTELIDLKKLIQSVVSDHRFMEGAENINIEIEVKDHHRFYSDNNRLNVILSNLVSNAIRYSNPEAEKKYIYVNIQAFENEVVFVIKDNGIGISEQHLPKIFEMFYRANENSNGTGLGLYIVQETLAMLDGTVQIESKEGLGTTFTLTIPNKV